MHQEGRVHQLTEGCVYTERQQPGQKTWNIQKKLNTVNQEGRVDPLTEGCVYTERQQPGQKTWKYTEETEGRVDQLTEGGGGGWYNYTESQQPGG